MDVKVSDDVLKKTTHCTHHFRCQSPEWQPCGKIACQIIGGKSLEGPEQADKRRECSYHVPFGDKHYCTCPTRKEIYRRYGV